MADSKDPKLTDMVEDQKPKLVDAIKGQEPDIDLSENKTNPSVQAADPVTESQVPQNAPHNAGFQSREDYLVHIGRGQDTKGRGSQRD